MFEGLQESIGSILNQIKGRKDLREESIDAALQRVRTALLEADVSVQVVEQLNAQVRETILSQSIPGGVNAGQYFTQQMAKALSEVLGNAHQELNLSLPAPNVIMLVGLQGSGKTTSTGKIAHWLKKQGHSVQVASTDVYRPAALTQLQVLAKQLDVECYDSQGMDNPLKIALQAVESAKKNAVDVLLLDNAGRLQIDETLMQEIANIHQALTPSEVLYVADGLSGQDAVNTALGFQAYLPLNGCMLTKMDGDSRGGAALSIRAVTQIPIKFLGVGEHMEELELFHPERIASRILGMGDMLSLIERAQSVYEEKNLRETERKLANKRFTLTDFQQQIKLMQKMGSMEDLLKMVPGMQQMAHHGEAGTRNLKQADAMICSMTPYERENYQTINPSRRNRIAQGSGYKPNDVHRMLKQFAQMSKQMQKLMQKGGMEGLDMAGNLPPNFPV